MIKHCHVSTTTEIPFCDCAPMVLSTSTDTIEVSFITWSEDTGSGDTPAGYVVQWREADAATWVEATYLPEERQSYNITYIFQDLEPSTQYMFQACPYIEHDGTQYEGNCTSIIHQTLDKETCKLAHGCVI